MILRDVSGPLSKPGAPERRKARRFGDQSATLFHDMITFDLLHRAMLGNKPTDDEIRHRIDAAIDAFLRGFART